MTQSASEQTKAARDILAERERQKAVEGWTAEHDDSHTDRSLASAASAYAYHASISDRDRRDYTGWPFGWRWDKKWWKPKSRREDLVRAGALILAEIERLDRMQP